MVGLLGPNGAGETTLTGEMATGSMWLQGGDASARGEKARITSELAVAMRLVLLTPRFHAFFLAAAAGRSTGDGVSSPESAPAT